MKVLKRIVAVLLISTIFTAFLSCGKTTDSYTPQKRIFYEYFDTVGTFYDYSGLSKENFSALADKVEKTLSEYHKLYDIYNEYEGITNLATLNKSAGHGKVKVDQKIIDLLLFAKEMHQKTNGKLNIAMGAVLKIWHSYREAGAEVPPEQMLISANEHTDINALIIDEENLTVELVDPKMSLDVGAVAKGYAVEMTAKMLEAEGYSGLVLDVGGNLRTIGKKPNGDGWKAGIKNPSSPYSQI